MSRVQIKFRPLTFYQFIDLTLCQLVAVSSSLRILVHRGGKDEIKRRLPLKQNSNEKVGDGNKSVVQNYIPLKDFNQLRIDLAVGFEVCGLEVSLQLPDRICSTIGWVGPKVLLYFLFKDVLGTENNPGFEPVTFRIESRDRTIVPRKSPEINRSVLVKE